MSNARTYKLFRETKTKTLNITASLIMVASSLGGALPALLNSKVFAAGDITVCSAGAPTCDYSSIQSAVDAASAGDTIDIQSGSLALSAPVTVNKAVIIRGEAGTVVTADNVNYAFIVTGAGATITNLSVARFSKGSNTALVGIQAANVTVSNSTFNGNWAFSDTNDTSRAFELSSTAQNVLITGNYINTLRGAAYINNGATGTISNNYTEGTKGWVVEGGSNITFTGNTWGTATVAGGNERNAVDIAIIPGNPDSTTDNYTDVSGLSQANHDAAVDNQMIGGPGTPHTLSDVYVDASASVGGNGYWQTPFQTIQAGVNAVATSGIVHVAAGTYFEDVVISKPMTVQGAGVDQSIIQGLKFGSNPNTVSINSSNATVEDFTITRDGNDVTDWNTNVNSQGVSFGQGTSNSTLQDSKITGNRNGVYVNQASANILNNTITDNRTGISLVNDFDGTKVTGNTISKNWTLGIVMYSATSTLGTNYSTVSVASNIFDQNWYTEVEIKNTPASTGTLNVTNNTFTDSPVTYFTGTNSSYDEPGYATQIPLEFGGTATGPANGIPTLRIYGSPDVTLTYDTAIPTNLRLKDASGTELACGAATNINFITPEWNAVNGAASYNYRVTLNGNQIVGYGSPYNVGNVTSISGAFGGTGLSTFSVQAVAGDGSVSAWSTPCAITYDNTAPTSTNDLPAVVHGTITVHQVLTDDFGAASGKLRIWKLDNSNNPDNSKFFAIGPVNVDGSNTVAYTLNSVSSLFGDGNYVAKFTSTDKAGNQSTQQVNFSVDNTAPSTPAATLTQDSNNASVPNGGYTNSQYFTFHLPSGADHYQLKYWNNISGSAFNGESNAWNPTNLSSYMTGSDYKDNFTQGEGTHYFSFSACDSAGNCSPYSTPFVVTYDKTAPVVAITAPSDGSTVSGTVTISGKVTDLNPDHYYLVMEDADGNVVAGPGTVNAADVTNYSWDTTGIADGTYTIDLEARDKAGNKDAGSVQTISVKVVNTPTQTGGGSNSTTTTTDNSSTTNTNNVTVTNLNRQVATTGNANNTGNTTGGNATTGDAANANSAVLGASTANNSNGKVKGDSTVRLQNASDKKSSNFIGLGWWWLAVVAAIGAFWLILAAKRRKRDDA